MLDRRLLGSGLVVSVLLIGAFAFWSRGVTAAEPAADIPAGPPVPIVLELFTSQGCSSCPPADELLSRFGEVSEAGVELIPLSYHVDYWNRLGWSDPFSSAEWSQRQAAYAKVLEGGRLYTPQLVINGRYHEVGSNGRRIETVLADERRRQPLAELRVSAERTTPEQLEVRVEGELASASAKPLSLRIALWQSGHQTQVTRGENARRALANDYVVRRLESRRQQAAASGDRFSESLTFKIDPDWPSTQLGVAAFLQQRDTLAVTGAASSRVTGP